MARPIAYEGSEPYIFISYAHKDSDRVLPIISGLQAQGFRVWYDAGIEAGTEWPEYIAEHLESCTVFLAFLSQSALDSPNCRREINFAIDECKEMLAVYLEELRLSAEMWMQPDELQTMFLYQCSSQESFIEELCRSRILAPCWDSTEAIAELFEFTKADDGGIEIQKLKDKNKTAVEIPWGVTSIGESTFSDCENLTSIIIPDSVTTIGEDAFSGCSNLTSITIPDSVTYIASGVFSGCSNLISVTIPDSIRSIGWGAFARCTSLTDITIPSSVINICEDAFNACESLTHVTILHGVTGIRTRAFYKCTNLTDITIPDSVTTIGENAFALCIKLTSITIPESVISIGKDAFFLHNFELTIRGKKGSVAEQYAAKKRIRFQAI